MLVLLVWEIVLGIIDFGRSLFYGGNFTKEFNFIYLRALICILLREVVTLGVKIDITRGLPIIHLNFAGYDEQAHNSGPSSKSAHWTLQGIDRAIENIYRKAMHSPRRSYDVWIYSDHGQEDVVSYAGKYCRTVQEAVTEVFRDFDATFDSAHSADKKGEQLYRARFLGFSFVEKIFRNMNSAQDGSLADKLIVTATGPTGNIYLPREMSVEKRHQFAWKLVHLAKIPVVMLPEPEGKVRVWTEEGEFNLPQDAGKILGEDHPFLTQATGDLIRVCHHPHAGDFTFSGFRAGYPPMTFPVEKGSHAGPGREETDAFALLPIDVVKLPLERTYLTPMDLRVAALRFLKRPVSEGTKLYPEILIPPKSGPVQVVETKTFRIMTYNVHACIGMDGKISTERIARVVGRHEPDIVALQELDIRRQRKGGDDQPHLIAKKLEMIYHFHPAIQVEEELYGDAVLSRYPMELIRAGRLCHVPHKHKVEPRGAIWTAINIGGVKVNFFNTHLGYLPREGINQTKALLGSEWLFHPVCQGPIILCGDFNASPRSQLFRNIKGVLRDVQVALENYNPRATWFGHYPLARIDHIFVSSEFEVIHVEVSRTDLDKIASDHPPLIVDV